MSNKNLTTIKEQNSYHNHSNIKYFKTLITHDILYIVTNKKNFILFEYYCYVIIGSI